MQIKKYIALLTIIVFTITQLQGCATVNEDKTNNTEYSSSNLITKKSSADTSSNSSIINTKTVSIGAGAIVSTGLLVVVGIALLNGLCKGLGQDLAGHIA